MSHLPPSHHNISQQHASCIDLGLSMPLSAASPAGQQASCNPSHQVSHSHASHTHRTRTFIELMAHMHPHMHHTTSGHQTDFVFNSPVLQTHRQPLVCPPGPGVALHRAKTSVCVLCVHTAHPGRNHCCAAFPHAACRKPQRQGRRTLPVVQAPEICSRGTAAGIMTAR